MTQSCYSFEQHLHQIFINHETKTVLGVNLNLHSCTRYFVILQSSANVTAPLLRSLCYGIALSSCTHSMAVRRKQIDMKEVEIYFILILKRGGGGGGLFKI